MAIRNDGSLWIWEHSSFENQTPVRYGVDYDWANVSVGWSYNPEPIWENRYILPVNTPIRAIKNNGSLWVSDIDPIALLNHNLAVSPPYHVISVHGSSAKVAAITACGFLGYWGEGISRTGSGIMLEGQYWKEAVASATQVTALLDDGSLWGLTFGLNNFAFWDICTNNDWARLFSAGGVGNSVFMMKTDGSIWAMGQNHNGVLGGGTTTGHIATPIMIWGQYAGATLTAGNAAGQPGDIVRVPISLQNNPGIAGYNLVIEFDNTKLTPVSISEGSALTIGMIFISNLAGASSDAIAQMNAVTAVWGGAEEDDGNGVIYTILFSASPSASGTTELTLASRGIGNADEEIVDFILTGASINFTQEAFSSIDGGGMAYYEDGDEGGINILVLTIILLSALVVVLLIIVLLKSRKRKTNEPKQYRAR